MSLSQTFEQNGFAIVEAIFTKAEVDQIIELISTTNSFAQRQLLHTIPTLKKILFNDHLTHLLQQVGGEDFFLTKAIFFSKPKAANWFVAYHQDLSISVVTKHEVEGYSNWIKKESCFNVQPPLTILNKTITIRIHLDDTNENNGALKVIPGSHHQGILNPKLLIQPPEKEKICPVPQGGVMLMKPLLFHASDRTINENNRRVIHLEFSNQALSSPLEWYEKYQY